MYRFTIENMRGQHVVNPDNYPLFEDRMEACNVAEVAACDEEDSVAICVFKQRGGNSELVDFATWNEKENTFVWQDV